MDRMTIVKNTASVFLMVLVFDCTGIASGAVQTGDDIEATNASIANNPPPSLASVMAKPSARRLSGAGSESKTYQYAATGDLRTWTSGSDITLYFNVTDHFIEIESASVSLMAYDVDYPVATENDVTYFNGTPLGWRLQGGNNSWHANNNIPVSPWLIRFPREAGGSEQNQFFVDVDSGSEGWVTCISEATLTIRGKVGIKVDASDGTESEGIKVEWTAVKDGATYTLYRAENSNMDGMKKIYSGKSLTYLDKSGKWFGGIKSGNVYFYQVEASTGEFGNDEGYYDAKIPEIEGLEFPEFWLADTEESGKSKMPFKIKWNDFDEERYEVSELYIMLNGRTDCQTFRLSKDKFPSVVHANAEQFIDTVKLDGWKLPTGFGTYQVAVVIKVLDKVEGKELNDGYFISTGNGKGSVNLFFDKYSKTGDKSNWYVYWPKEGAIDRTYVGEKFEYKPQNYRDSQGKTYEDIYGMCRMSYEHSKVSRPLGFPELVKFDGQEYWIFDLGAAHSGYTGIFNGNQVGSTKTGLEFLAAAMAHECRHGELNEETYNHGWVLGSPHNNSGYATVADVLAALQLYGYDSTYSEYYNAVRSAKCDLDGDGVLDEHEDGKYHDKWNFSKTNPNTHNFPDYPGYGDNEVLARYAELNPTVAIWVNTGKDWAFPGNNNHAEAMGDDEVTWLSKRDEILNSVFDDFSGGRRVASRSTKIKARGKLLGGAAQYDGAHNGGALMSVPTLTDISDGIISIGDVVTDNTAASSTAYGYSKLSLQVSVINTGVSFPALIRGYLVDNYGSPIAWAESFAEEIPYGTTNVTLEFPAAVIRSMKGSGYRLAAVEVYANNGDMGMVRCVKTNVGATSAIYQSNLFVGNVANVLYNTCDETATSKYLDINVIVDAMEAGEYKLQGRLETTNGEFVATASTSGWFDKGETLAKLSFAGEDIYLSGQDGPYILQYVSIEDDTFKLDDRLSVYTTANYSHNYFVASDVTVSVDASTFVRMKDEVNVDGSIDGLKFAFDTTNLTIDTLVCRVKATLFGTNDLFVCSFDEQIPLTNGANRVEVFFAGNEIRSSSVGGPYYVGDVLLEPVSGAAERFVPNMAPIDLSAEDFGVFPFAVNGELAFGGNANGGGYQLCVPIEIFRANTVTVTAMLVDANGKFVAIATAVKNYTASCADCFTLTFSEQDMLASERKGPYTVRFVQIESSVPGVNPVRVNVPDTAKDISNTYIRYVDINAVDGGNGYSWGTAFSTIQEAVDAADDGDVILVADGVYAPFDTRNKSIEIKSLNGYEYTVINGGGTNRCATLGFEESQTNSVLTGFTLLDGDATTSNVLVLWNCGGGVCCGTVRNCWIEGCAASKGGGAYYGVLEGCVIRDNTASTSGGGSYYGKRINCTIVDNASDSDGGGTYYGSTFNSIVLGNYYYFSSSYVDNYYGGDFAYSLTSPYVEGEGNVSGDAGFRDPRIYDYSLMRSSVCVDAGCNNYVTTEFDIAGNRRVAGGNVDIGAYELRRSKYVPGYCDFALDEIVAREGDVIEVSLFGGLSNQPCSAQLYLTYNTAAAADINLANGSVDGVVPKGGLKFPLTVSWDAGETGEKTVVIPVTADTAFEANEFFTLQLANPKGMSLGDFRVCTVTIKDVNTKATLADGIKNQTLKPTSSGAGAWCAVEGWNASPAESDCAIFVESPTLLAGKTSTLSFGSIKGSGYLYFSMKFLGEQDSGASFVDVYDGKTKLGTITRSANGDDWYNWQVSLQSSGTHTVSLVFTQGLDTDSRVRVANVIWTSSSSSYCTINANAQPSEAGFVSGCGTCTYGTKVSLKATPRPGYDFAGWYYSSSGKLVSSKASLTFTANGSADLVALFRKPPYVRGLAEPASAGKVTGSGPCAVGKKVSLAATANKGFVFEGWYDERDIRLTQAASLSVDNTSKPAKATDTLYVVTNVVSDVTYYARFVTVEEDKASIACSVFGVDLQDVSVMTYHATLPCGVWANWPVVASAHSQTTVKVVGLPSGLKYNASTGSIEGAPTAPSKVDAKTNVAISSPVKITVTTAGKSSKTYQIDFVITPLPDTALGTFNGFVSPYDADQNLYYKGQSIASFTLTTTAAGKITAKTIGPKGTISFTANYWGSLEDGSYSVMLYAKSGEILLLYLDSEPQYWNGSNHVSGFAIGGSFGSELYYVEAQRSSFLKAGGKFEHQDAVEVAKALQGTYKFEATYVGDYFYEMTESKAKTATLTVTIKDTGAVTVAGTISGTTFKISGTGVLRVYPSTCEAELLVSYPYSKIVNLMLDLWAIKDEETNTVSFDGGIRVNVIQ